MVLQTVIRPPSAGRHNLDEQPTEQPRNEGGVMSVKTPYFQALLFCR